MVVQTKKTVNVSLLIDVAVFTAAVFAATVVIQIYQPATGGYFNLGESVIYVAALIKTPLTAGIAGGVGAALADLATGYGIFAPGTLVIKFIEGCLAGALVKKIRGGRAGASPIPAVLVSALYTGLVVFFAARYYAGEIYFGPSYVAGFEVESPLLNVPTLVWFIVAFTLGFSMLYVLLRRFVRSVEAPLLLLAGFTMVLGYFLYQFFYSNPVTGRDPWAAVAEIPVNIGQAVVGASVAIPVAGWLRRAGYGKTS